MKKFIFKLYIAALIIFPFSNLYSTHSQENSPVSVRASSQEDDLSLLAGIMSADQPSWLYTSDLITSEIPAWMIALKISLYTPSAVDYRLSYQSSADNITWSAWHPLYLSEREADDLELFTDPYGLDQQSSYFHYQIQVAPDNQTALSNIKNVKLVALDPTDPAAQINSRLVAPAAAQEEFNVITRTEWGADESIMFWDEDMEHEAIDQIVLHHTATNDNSPLDPEATIRGIYYYHTVDRGWGDIGYNYIVDQHGNIYEGRKGGLGSVAAHAEGFNSGSVGISVLGNYEEVAPVQDSQGAVANIISFVSYQTNLDLEGTVEINGKTYPTVVGHRDVNATSCPGAKYYELIPDVIEQAIADSQNDGPKTFDAEFVDQSDYQIDLYNTQTKDVTVEYKNTGNAVWQEGLDQIVVVTTGQAGRDSQFADTSWISTAQVGDMYRYSVMPGDMGQFQITFSGIKQKGKFLEKFALQGPDGILADSEFSVTVNALGDQADPTQITKPTNKYGISATRYHATFYDGLTNITVQAGEKKKIWLEFTNDGDNIWYNFDPFPMHLGTVNEHDRASQFYSADNWLTNNRINLFQTYVEPGQVGHFEFTIDATQATPGTYHESFSPVLEHLTWLNAEAVVSITVI